VSKKLLALIIGSCAASIGSGFAAGYLFAQKRLMDQMDARVEIETRSAKLFYENLYRKNEFATPSDVLAKTAAESALSIYQGNDPPFEVEHAAEKPHKNRDNRGRFVHNIFDDGKAEIILDTDPPVLPPDMAYIISEDAFLSNEVEHEQVSITYYVGDDILADEKDEVVPDADALVGEDALLQFGHMSNDDNIVYVRNPRLNLDFEVQKSMGKYAVEVLGLDDPAEKKRRSNRGDDE